MANPSLPTTAQIVEKYIKMRDKKAALKKDLAEKTAKLDEAMDLIEAHLLARFQADGVTSMATPEGTAYQSSRVSAKVEDWDAALDFIKKHKLWHMLERRVGKEAVAQYNEEHGQLPPGISMTEELTINVRRS